MGVRTFVSKNLVALVMVPVLVGVHYGWYQLQQIDSLVQPEERARLPLLVTIQNMFDTEGIAKFLEKEKK